MNTIAKNTPGPPWRLDARTDRPAPPVHAQQHVEAGQRQDAEDAHAEPLIEAELRPHQQRDGARLPSPETRQPQRPAPRTPAHPRR